MSFRPSYASTSQSSILLDEIEKAFKEVSFFCREFIERRFQSPTSEKQSIQNIQFSGKINFNNYKGNFDPKADLAEKIRSFDVDGKNFEANNEPNKTLKDDQKNKKIDANSRWPNPASREEERKSKQQKGVNKLMEKIIKNPSSQIPAPPKAPLSPYFIFYREKKDVIKSELPEMSVSEITSAAAKVWKSLTEEEREPFNKKFFEEKERYNKLMREYVEKYPNYREMHKKVGQGIEGNNKK